MKKDELEEKVETLIDQTNLHQVLTAISRVCGYKASHVEEAWQDQAGNVELLARRAGVPSPELQGG